jgi:NAD(P)-dependent dehydrogenase (short-subunit alcohol dehydrogenase family)
MQCAATATKPGIFSYATSKAALIGLTCSLSVKLDSRDRVDAINPAAVSTPMLLDGFSEKDDQYAELAAMHPVGRIAEPSEIALAGVFLASEKASFISGTALDVYGGILSRLHDPE